MPDTKAVLLTHNETSTGVMNPIAELAAAIRARGTRRADPRRQRVGSRRGAVRDGRLGRRRRRDRIAEGVDGGPGPGDDRGITARRGQRWSMRRCRASTSTCERIARRRRVARRPSRRRSRSCTRSTRACASCSEEGAEAIFARHEACAAATRAGLAALGFELFADARYYSRTVTAASVPDGLDWKSVQRRPQDARPRAGRRPGQADRVKIFRVGHLGSVTLEEILGRSGYARDGLAPAGSAGRPRVGGRGGAAGGHRARGDVAALTVAGTSA